MGTSYYADAAVPMPQGAEYSDEFQELFAEQQGYYEQFESFWLDGNLHIFFGGECGWGRVDVMPDWWERVAQLASGPFKIDIDCNGDKYSEWYGKDSTALIHARIADLSAERDAISAQIATLRAELEELEA